MKVICQNCFDILADRNKEEHTITLDPDKFPRAVQEMSRGASLLTLTCPRCGCMLQVKL